MNTSIIELLAENGIYGPGSPELEKYERHLTRYFEREYRRIEEHRTNTADLYVFSDQGSMSQQTRELMEGHYDEKIEFFNCFLDTRYLAYTMAYYGDTPDLIRNSKISLEEAQHNKFDLITKRIGIKGNERILNIGCGFAPLETFLLTKHPDLEIIGVTPSKVQADYINARKLHQGDPLCTNNFSLIWNNFECVELDDESFDIVITIGLFEHVTNIKYVMQRIASLLKPNGKAFHHFITSKYAVPQLLDPNRTRIGAYFPGGHIWPATEIIKTECLQLEGYWYVNGLNYWRTLQEWHHRYWNSISTLMDKVFDIPEIDHWNKYFSLCKVMFCPLDGTFYGNSHYLFRKPEQ